MILDYLNDMLSELELSRDIKLMQIDTANDEIRCLIEEIKKINRQINDGKRFLKDYPEQSVKNMEIKYKEYTGENLCPY